LLTIPPHVFTAAETTPQLVFMRLEYCLEASRHKKLFTKTRKTTPNFTNLTSTIYVGCGKVAVATGKKSFLIFISGPWQKVFAELIYIFFASRGVGDIETVD
jgi:hypothetical protein